MGTQALGQVTPQLLLGVTTDFFGIEKLTTRYFNTLIAPEHSPLHGGDTNSRPATEFTDLEVIFTQPTLMLELNLPLYKKNRWTAGVKATLDSTSAKLKLPHGLTLNSSSVPITFSEPVAVKATMLNLGASMFLVRDISPQTSLGAEIGLLKSNIALKTTLGDWVLDDRFDVSRSQVAVWLERSLFKKRPLLKEVSPSVRFKVFKRDHELSASLELRTAF